MRRIGNLQNLLINIFRCNRLFGNQPNWRGWIVAKLKCQSIYLLYTFVVSVLYMVIITLVDIFDFIIALAIDSIVWEDWVKVIDYIV